MSWTRRLLDTFRAGRVDREVEEEIRFHLEMRARELVDRGMPPDEAFHATRRRFGNITRIREQTREADLLAWIEILLRDIVIALRTMRNRPAMTAVAVLSLALTMGANTVMFTILDNVVLKPLPVQNPERLILLKQPARGAGPPVLEAKFQHAMFERLRANGDGIVDLFGCGPATETSAILEGAPHEVYRQPISGDAFAVLGIRPFIGRTLSRGDDSGNHPDTAVALLSHGFWKRRFAGNPAVLGKTIVFGDRPYHIVGVAEPAFFGVEVGAAVDVWTPIAAEPPNVLLSRSPWVRILGRLRPGVTMDQVQPPLQGAFSAMHREQARGIPPDSPKEIVRQFLSQQLVVLPGARGLSPLRERLTEPLVVVVVVSALVLLIACTNIANLLLARGAARGKEMAVRSARGGGRGRLIRQAMTESVLLALISGALGLWLAALAVPFVLKQLAPEASPVRLDLQVDWRVVAFTASLSVFAAILFGLWPAWKTSRVNIASVMKGAKARGRARGNRVLGSAQVALSLLLVIGAAMFVGTWRNLVRVDAGFDREGLFLVMMQMRAPGQDEAASRRVWQEILRRCANVPGVNAASLSGFSPFSAPAWTYPVNVPGREIDPEDPGYFAVPVSAGYFHAMGTRLLRGRDFEPRDMLENAPYTVVVNETFARRYFPLEDPIGRKFASVDLRPGVPGWMEIIGVVADTKYSSLRADAPALSYLPVFHMPAAGAMRSAHIQARGDANAGSLPQALRREVAGAGAGVTVQRIVRLSSLMDETLIQELLLARLSGFFGATALLLACAGLYGLMNYSVVRRTKEIGIRMAMGARQGTVLVMILRDTLFVVLGGVAAGIAVALALTRFIASLLFGISGHEPEMISVAVTAVVAAVLIAAYVPARRASRMDPLATLRCE